MEVTLKKGTLFINDDITIEFEEAFLKMSHVMADSINPFMDPSLKKETYEKPGGKKVFKISKPVKVKLPKVKPIPVSHLSGIQNFTRSDIEEIVFDFMKENKVTSVSDLLDKIHLSYPGVTRKYLSNILTKHKGKGTIRSIEYGTYELTSKKVEPVTKKEPAIKKTILPKTEKQKVEPKLDIQITDDRISGTASGFELPDNGIIPAIENNNETFFHYYSSGDGIIIGDNIRVLTSEAVTEDDILTFDPDLTDKFGVVMTCDEGSNMIKIKTNREDREVLVYPHWIKLVTRK